MTRAGIAVAGLIALAGCQAGGAGVANVQPVVVSKEDASQLAHDGTTFGFELYKTVAAESEAGDNLFLSPWSVHAALAMTYAGARGQTANEMRSALSLSLEGDALHRAFQAQTAALVGEHDGNTVSVGNAFFAGVGYPFRPEYLSVLRTSYGAEAQNVDFAGNPDRGRKVVNNWVENQTNRKIKDLFPQGSIDAMTRLVLANAIHFLGKWEDEFNADETRDEPFLLAGGGEATAPLMRDTRDVDYHRGEGFQAVRVPYKGGRLAMIILLPDDRDGLPALEQRVSAEFLSSVTGGLHHTEVYLFFPKFEFDASFSLAAALQSLGMKAAFGDGADLSGMDGTKNLFIQSVRHKAYVRVDEKGTEAAAATGVAADLTAMPEAPPLFRADHPFLFLIQDRETGALLFLGRLVKPT